MAQAILVVHGVGEQQKGDTLRRFTNGMVGFLYRRLKEDGIPSSALKLTVDLQNGSAGLRLDTPPQPEEYVVQEVWWARVFQPPDLMAVTQWILLAAVDRVKLALQSLTWNPVTWVYALVMPLVMALAGLVLLLLLYGTQALLLLPILSQPIKNILAALQKRAANFMVTVAGDVNIYATDWVYSTEMREELEQHLANLESRQDIQGIHVVGHSLGSLVAYEALSRTYPVGPNSKLKTVVTVGSPLDKVNMFFPKSHQFRFESPLPPGIEWLNIYSPTDLVSDHLVRYGPPPAGPHNIRVSNRPLFLFFKEHSSYWQNPAVMRELLSKLSASTVVTAQPQQSIAQSLKQVAQFYLPRGM
jgi:hypothetical protein